MKLAIGVLALLLAVPSHAVDFYYSLTRSEQPLSDAPANVDVVKSSSWENSTARTVADAIENEQGIVISRNGSMGSLAEPFIRGFNTSQILVVIDDVPQLPDLTGTVDLSRISLDNVDRIEIIRGGVSAVYGPNAVGGVIHIITKTPQRLVNAEYSGIAGSFNTYTNRVLAGSQYGPLQAQVTASRDLSSGFQQNAYYHNTNLTGLLAYDADGYGKFTYYTAGALGVLGLPSGTPVPLSQFNGTAERQANDTVSHQNERDNNSRLQYDNHIGIVDVTARVANNIKNLDAFNFGSDTYIRTEGRNAFAKAEIPGLGVMGYEFYQRRLDSTVFGINRDNAWGAFVEIFSFSNDMVTFTPGGRYDHDNAYRDSWSPRVQLIVKPNQAWKFSASASRSFRAPAFSDLFDPFVPPPFPQVVQLNPEITWSYDVGATVIPTKGMEVTVALFRSDTRDRITTDPNRGFAAFNIGRSYSQGVEPSISYSIGGVHQSLSYSYLEALGENSGTNFQWLAFSPKHTVHHRIDVNLPYGVTVTNIFRYVHRQWTGLGETGVQLPGYATDNIRIVAKTSWIEPFVEVDNILDRHYAEAGDTINGFFPQPGRAYYGGITLRFQS